MSAPSSPVVKQVSLLRQFFNKHFLQKLPKISQNISFSREDFLSFWTSLPDYTKQQSLIFFSKDLIQLVNKTNTKLLCSEVVNKKKNNASESSKDYQLLNAFEMLWNIDNSKGQEKGALNHLVEALSHQTAKEISNHVEGHALVVKDEFVKHILQFCEDVNPLFLRIHEKILIKDEQLLIRAINSNSITSWELFEQLLALIVENRLTYIYLGHLESEYKKQSKKIEADILKKPRVKKNKNEKRKAKKQQLSIFKKNISSVIKI